MNNSNLGLENIGNLSELLGNAEVSSGTPLRLPLASIKEDPDQPRKEFDEGKIQELANSIQERGVKTPISVRQSSEEGVYVINHGARRYRASLLAGLSEIPAYIDQDYSLIDQAVENIQRDNLTPREIADVIGRLLAEGMKKGQIAEKMGKSPAFVTQHANLLDLPEPLANAFNSGKVS
ncbi:ParB/RepB/Spo0J family partition protein, partial [Neisseria gonorrhoeae]